MSDRPRVSVVSAFYNRGSLVQESIGSLLTQTLEDIEIIVVNDGSTDDTAARLDEIRDHRLRVIHQANAGFTAAIRLAVSRCRSDYVAVHGAGDVSLPNRLELQAAYLDEHENVGLVGCRYTNDGVLMRAESTEVECGPLSETFINKCRVSHGETMFRKALYDRVDGYRLAFTFAQDHDLWLRMGVFCDYAIIPEVLYHRKRLPTGVFQNVEQFYMQRKLAQFAVECASQRRESGRDVLDRYGPSAFYLSRPTKKLSRTLGRRALILFRQGRHDAGAFLAKKSWQEWRDLQSFKGLFLAWLAESDTRRRLLKPILRLWRS